MNFDTLDIVDGLKNNEFFLEYQPICKIDTGKIVGVEALLRWSSSRFGAIIKPDLFIPFVIQKSLMPVLGAKVIRLACREISVWKSIPIDFFISINVCPSQLIYEKFPAFLEHCMAKYDINPMSLRIEITEHVPFEVTRKITKAIDEIRQLGCKVILDDFGSGYMSLSKFSLLEVDGIKITLEDYYSGVGYSNKCQTLVSAVAFMASATGISLVVERIETTDQKIVLSQFPGILGQGYYFGRPVRIPPDVEFSLAMFAHSGAS